MKFVYAEAKDKTIMFKCPGCKDQHWIPVEGPRAWKFNGDMEKPTLHPSILARSHARLTNEQCDRIMAGEKIEPVPTVCHSYVTDGRIMFLNDCTHPLAGQTVDLLDWVDS